MEGRHRLRACLQDRWLQLCKPPPALQCRRSLLPLMAQHLLACLQAQPGARAHSRVQWPGGRGALLFGCVYRQRGTILCTSLSAYLVPHALCKLSPPCPSSATLYCLQVAKNIVLAGVGSVALVDDTPCSLRPPSNFLVPADAPAGTT